MEVFLDQSQSETKQKQRKSGSVLAQLKIALNLYNFFHKAQNKVVRQNQLSFFSFSVHVRSIDLLEISLFSFPQYAAAFLTVQKEFWNHRNGLEAIKGKPLVHGICLLIRGRQSRLVLNASVWMKTGRAKMPNLLLETEVEKIRRHSGFTVEPSGRQG